MPNVHNVREFRFHSGSFNEVRQKVSNLKNSKSNDCFNLNVKIIKTLKNLLISPMTRLINHCISAGVFPTVLKKAKVVPNL